LNHNSNTDHSIGDLVYVRGQLGRLWKVLSSVNATYYVYNEEMEYVTYVVECPYTLNRITVLQSDLMHVCEASKADEFLYHFNRYGAVPKEYKTKEKRYDPMSNHKYPDTLDGLLDELSDTLLKIEIRGEEDDELKEKLSVIKEKLEEKRKELAGETA